MAGMAVNRFNRGRVTMNSAGGFNQFSGQEAAPPDFSPGNAYSQAIPQQAQDYDEIMQGYRGQLGDPNGDQAGIMSGYRNLMGQNSGPYENFGYQEGPEMQNSFGVLDNLQKTGGLSAKEQQDLRSRGTSPIRAIYDQMSKKIDRGRSLGGGYSPSYNATASRMARESSEGTANALTNVNAGIAEMVQKGKLSGAGMYANQAAGKNNLMNNMTVANAENKTKWAQNQGNILSGWQGAQNAQAGNRSNALQGMTSLYGTTPALVNTFGNQVMQQGQQRQNASQQKRQNRLGALNAYAGRR